MSVLVELANEEALLEAVRKLRHDGLSVETYTPWPVEGLDEALDLPPSPIPKLVLAAGVCGAVVAWLIQWWTNAVDYPLNVGDRPPHAVPAFVLITFETTVLFAGLTAFVATLLLAGLPRLWHHAFEVDAFKSASIDGFWVEAMTDDLDRVEALVRDQQPKCVVRAAS